MITYLVFILFFTQGMLAADLSSLVLAASLERQSSTQTGQEVVPYPAQSEYIQSPVDGSIWEKKAGSASWELWQGQVSTQMPMSMNPGFSYGTQGMGLGTQVMPMQHGNLTEKSRLEFVMRASQVRGWPLKKPFEDVIKCCLFETIVEEELLKKHTHEIEAMLSTLPIEQRGGLHYTRLATELERRRRAIKLKRYAINRTMDHIDRATKYLKEYDYPPSSMYFNVDQMPFFNQSFSSAPVASGPSDHVGNHMAHHGQLGHLYRGGI